ncbi:alpha-L-rhamnosidase C-terminal domain-containing protein [Arthrobacter globiformis]|uniref:alpha-L-rhamnosidase C-terminal domain-containing protein n=1 Tax=Arthrobacter globiformis TaxID=1665 RepID=UPI0027D85229|nr:alpha-L-rhamnosidase C-terminal domain-containing protein [Arthrobacter globiformis]
MPADPAEEETAYRRLAIAPQPGGGITSASAAVVTPRGRISVAWTLKRGQFTLEVDLPYGVEAAVAAAPDSGGRRGTTVLNANGGPQLSVRTAPAADAAAGLEPGKT